MEKNGSGMFSTYILCNLLVVTVKLDRLNGTIICFNVYCDFGLNNNCGNSGLVYGAV